MLLSDRCVECKLDQPTLENNRIGYWKIDIPLSSSLYIVSQVIDPANELIILDERTSFKISTELQQWSLSSSLSHIERRIPLNFTKTYVVPLVYLTSVDTCDTPDKVLSNFVLRNVDYLEVVTDNLAINIVAIVYPEQTLFVLLGLYATGIVRGTPW